MIRSARVAQRIGAPGCFGNTGLQVRVLPWMVNVVQTWNGGYVGKFATSPLIPSRCASLSPVVNEVSSVCQLLSAVISTWPISLFQSSFTRRFIWADQSFPAVVSIGPVGFFRLSSQLGRSVTFVFSFGLVRYFQLGRSVTFGCLSTGPSSYFWPSFWLDWSVSFGLPPNITVSSYFRMSLSTGPVSLYRSFFFYIKPSNKSIWYTNMMLNFSIYTK